MKLPSNEKAELFAVALIASGGTETLNAFPWCEGLFYHGKAKAIYHAIERLVDTGESIDAIKIATEVHRVGDADKHGGFGVILADMVEGNGMHSSAAYYFRVLADLHISRRTMLAVSKNMRDLSDLSKSPAEFAEAVAQAAVSLEVSEKPDLKTQLNELLALIETAKTRERYPTGLEELDSLLDGGVEPGELFVVGGETSSGKSVLLQMATIACGLTNLPTVVYSLEMPSSAILARFTANVARCPVMQGENTQYRLNAISRAVMRIAKMPLTIRDDLFTLSDIIRDARVAVAAGAKVIVIDYIQRVEYHDPKSREQAVSEISRQMKRLAMQTGVAVFTATQLNDEGRVRESRAISQDADILALIRSDDKGTTITLDKFRRGERFRRIDVKLNGALARFEPAEFKQKAA